MSEVLKKFGRYFLLDRLAQGGMAEIYRARLASPDGAGRLIVIKRVISGHGNNREFLQMFRSEIKVTMGFSHPNIVQLYDFGEEQGQPFIAMEFVDGKSLRQMISRFQELQQPFPVELAAYIIEQSAAGLFYAHSFKDKISGTPLNIVHRDISPQNILVSYEGNVKVIDFGIAKATTNMESTRVGVIKGKPSYLSPEQISGEPLDGRSDIFALGTVLWELLVGKKLFSGDNDLAVLKLIESSQTHIKAPSTLNPRVPKELDYIVLKSLAKSKEKRFQTAEEFHRTLHKFLIGFAPDFSPSDLSYCAKDLFKDEIIEDRKTIQKLAQKADQLLSTEVPNLPISDALESTSTVLSEESDTATGENAPLEKTRLERSGSREAFGTQTFRKTKVEIESHPPDGRNRLNSARSSQGTVGTSGQTRAGIQNSTASSSGYTSSSILRPGTSQNTAPQRRNTATHSSSWQSKSGPLFIILLLIFLVFGQEFGIKIPYLSDFLGDWIGGSEARLTLRGNEKGVTVTVNGQTVASALPAMLNGIPVGTPFRVSVISSRGTFQQEVTLKKGEKKEVDVAFTQSSSISAGDTQKGALPDKSIYLRLGISPAGGSPKINLSGHPIDPNNPVTIVPLDTPLNLTIERTGYKPLNREFVLDAQQVAGQTEYLMDITLEPTHFGFLTIHTTPSAEATLMLDGVQWKRKTPFENEKLPAGEYTVRLTNNVLGMEKTIPVAIPEGRTINVEERLEIKN